MADTAAQDTRSIYVLFATSGPVEYIAFQYGPDKRFLGFAFVRYAQREGVLAAIRMFNCNPDPQDVVPLSGGIEATPEIQQLGLRVMSKQRWQAYRDEYKQHLKDSRVRVDEQIKQRRRPVTFTEGTIVRVHGLHPHSVREGLADLFGGPFGTIEHVDYTRGQVSGYLRFVEPAAAQRCVAYFATHWVYHATPEAWAKNDATLLPGGTKPTPAGSGERDGNSNCDLADAQSSKSEVSMDIDGPTELISSSATTKPPLAGGKPTQAEPPLLLRAKVLQGKEELHYWNIVRSLWHAQQTSRQTGHDHSHSAQTDPEMPSGQPPPSTGTHIHFGDD
ncbi:hypothetical protein BJ085DRAFT_32106 [Dimargaris cristalligena]|uniref:Uncharacterized protein n=1 Tax=Dimargaris cristalligena TaxID=215637 RepID=A0A4Q0A311_9FUNG|nr:hypothetical protein BJ085DRAFT_32106 [Dimargaris cristalligena]|eukprot:RKP40238.1 hypothetical protein BJ085DRAFT_32106 [Dimargaris cristalligena]